MREDASRFPVSTYDDACRWLWNYSRPEDWLFDPDADLPREAHLVCDVFWRRPAELVADMRRNWNEALAPPSRRVPHHQRRHSWGR